MTQRVQKQLDFLKSGAYKQKRCHQTIDIEQSVQGLCESEKVVVQLSVMLEGEVPHFIPEDRIGFHRYRATPPAFKISKDERIIDNITPDYYSVLSVGLDEIQAKVRLKKKTADEKTKAFYDAVLRCADSALSYADRVKNAAKAAGVKELYNALCQVPHSKATSLLEACVFMKFIIFTLRAANHNHITLGSFDRYMRPFYEADRKKGKTKEELLEIIEEFFISLNFDTDLYFGMQQGDNGQSLVLGGRDADRKDTYCELSELCMQASLELDIIDPKINLRVDSNTPKERYEFATRLTRQGLGFPQYSNDDIVIPGLIDLGYAPQDAANYTMAACWEFIIPGKGMDVPNLRTMNYPAVVEKVTAEQLIHCDSFDAFFEKVKEEIAKECRKLMESAKNRRLLPAPYLSIFMTDCLDKGKDVAEGGATYYNYGCHGAGLSTAADALYAIKQVIYDEKSCSKEQLLQALKTNFAEDAALRNKLLSCPKMGQDDDRVDGIASKLMHHFALQMNGKPNTLGGIYRAGTGSAMEYVLSAARVGATADGRKSGEPYGSSFSPSLQAKLSGPLSCIKSFTKQNLKETINGGPLTMELSDTVFHSDDGIQKVAALVRAFIARGGHQLQLNTIQREKLLEAEKHPELYKNLIVRVWGWSGYFVELDQPYREHILQRTAFQI